MIWTVVGTPQTPNWKLVNVGAGPIGNGLVWGEGNYLIWGESNCLIWGT